MQWRCVRSVEFSSFSSPVCKTALKEKQRRMHSIFLDRILNESTKCFSVLRVLWHKLIKTRKIYSLWTEIRALKHLCTIGRNQTQDLSILLNFRSNLKVAACKIRAREVRAHGSSWADWHMGWFFKCRIKEVWPCPHFFGARLWCASTAGLHPETQAGTARVREITCDDCIGKCLCSTSPISKWDLIGINWPSFILVKYCIVYMLTQTGVEWCGAEELLVTESQNTGVGRDLWRFPSVTSHVPVCAHCPLSCCWAPPERAQLQPFGRRHSVTDGHCSDPPQPSLPQANSPRARSLSPSGGAPGPPQSLHSPLSSLQ